MSRQNLVNKTAIVTGGTRGIGHAIAERLLEEGARVAICGTRQKSVDDALDLLSPKGDTFGVVADISKLEDVRNFVSAVMQKFSGIDILVNNAGAGIFRAVADLTPEEWQRMIGLNLTGTYYCCHEILPIFRQAGGGDVVNISSLAGKNAFAGGAGYNATKFGLNGFSEALMLDYRNEGIRVSTIMPGSVDTEFGRNPAESDRYVRRDKNAWKIAPEDIAEIVVTMLLMPRRTTVSSIEVRPSRPPGKT
ncbi:MAG TPA: SDR family oxidoreductase [Bryobacteraceae bacterium]|jgi:NAD(P)-dependent dehydrogenase (short-subunit alcohol dehydrogenase family)|nr:SDR family oxidoreductase [Bryobacteraceae bacterium]